VTIDAQSTDEPTPSTARPGHANASSAWRGVLASIDMGSNSFRLEIGRCTGNRYRRIDYLKETVRLGAGLDQNGRLSDEAAQRGLACLARFRQRLDGIAPAQLRAVATQTLREATNRDEFLHLAGATLSHPIEVISGREEARLIYKGVARLQPGEAPRLVIDIGGRSTEMILGHAANVIRAESFRVGSVSLSMQFFPDGRYSAAAFQAAQVATGAELEEALVPFARQHWRDALGSSGTAGAVSDLLRANGVTDGRITPEALRWCMRACLEAGSADRLQLPGLKPERRAVLGGGLAILYTLATHFEIDCLLPARGALRQGVIFDLEERRAAERQAVHHDMRDDSVAELQQRFGVDRSQARRVEALAQSLYRQIAPQASLELQRELGWAAALHEIGMMVSHHDHHRHSAYLLGHVDAAGFSQSQQRGLADLVLGQRGGLRKVESTCADPERMRQLLALRLAVLLCHARLEPPQGLKLEIDAREIRLHWPAAWASGQLRSVYLLREEGETWRRMPEWRVELPA
jgi:exopolyphosphatase/guanosine-5'-triphosphate,3'-diphosphate pyrophosphatase